MKPNFKSVPGGVAITLAISLLGPTSLALAQTTYTGSGDWFDVSKWSTGLPNGTAGKVTGSAQIKKPGAAAALLAIDGLVEVEKDDKSIGNIGDLSVQNEIDVGNTGSGELDVRTGGHVSSGGVYISKYAGSTGFALVDGTNGGATWINYGAFFVGSAGFVSGSGALSIKNGGSVSNVSSASGTGFSVGSGVAIGTVTVDNSSLSSDNFIRVGDGGTATMFLQNHATASDLTGIIGYGNGTTSSGTGSVGTVTVDNAAWTNSGDLDVGTYAIGNLNIINGGTVSSNFGNIGFGASGVGTVDISNSTWTVTSRLAVGLNGQGTLTIRNGATVASGLTLIGVYEQAVGAVTVDHATWTNSGELVVASGITGLPNSHAVGTLDIVNGGTVSSANGFLGSGDGAKGTVTVAGVNADGSHSAWAIGNELYVGDYGLGTLNIDGGGIVSSQAIYIGYHHASPGSTVNLSGAATARGILETGQISNGTGAGPKSGHLNFDGGILRATADQSNLLRNFGTADVVINSGGAIIDSNNHNIGIATPLQGNGGLTKIGAGTLDLTGANIYGGLTTVDAGKLLVNGSVAGGALVNSGATLGGSGNVQGTVTVAPGGILSPGNSPGTLTMGGLMLFPDAVLNIDIGTLSDHLIVNGDLTLDGTLNLFGDPSFFANGDFPSFISYTGKLIDNGLVIGSVPPGFSASNFVLDFSQAGVVGISNVPLPSAAIFLMSGLLSLGGLYRRRR